MKFSALLSTLFAALAVAGPIAIQDVATEDAYLQARADPVIDEDAHWKKAFGVAKAAGVNIAANSYHYFQVEWPLGSTQPPANKETAAEIKKVQEKLGFDHVAVIVGQFEEVSTTSKVTKKNPVAITTITRKFKARMYDLIKMTDGKTDIRSPNWDSAKGDSVGKTLRYVGATTKAKQDKVPKTATDYKTDNPVYKADSVNCGTFRDAVVKVLK